MKEQFKDRTDLLEKRQCERVVIDMDIEVCHLPDEDSISSPSVISCRGRDISGGGVSFYGQARYQDESLLRLRIPLCSRNSSQQEERARLVKVMGKVKWCEKNETTSGYVTGVQFLNIYEEDFHLLNDHFLNLQSG